MLNGAVFAQLYYAEINEYILEQSNVKVEEDTRRKAFVANRRY